MDKIIIQRKATQVREKFGVDHHSPIDLFSLVNSDPNLTLVLYPFPDSISGMCIKSANLIAINMNSTKGRQIFSLAHELYHYYFDDEDASVSYFSSMETYQKEVDANHFASYLLMPDASFSHMLDKLTNKGQEKVSLLTVIKLEQYFKVSRSAVLTRLLSEKVITQDEELLYKTNVLKTAKQYGFDISLYTKQDTNQPKTYGAYLKLALTLKDRGIISEGKYESYLIEAYRSDIVFDENGDSDSDE
jgi:Zn-dependent peptidase ImmA (M78 family)